MKVLARSIAAALAVCFAIAPLSAQAQNYQPHKKPAYQTSQKHHAQKPPVKRHKWSKGQRYSDWKRRPPVRDYKRYGLRAPARGQQWVKVDNDYLLVSVATGLILGLTNGR
ncbi:RcnB family protein [Shinella sp. S4-D37]|uniref:RcnB family protein n=1 Tax=Shinella sp. S4-D37 TaxID=3161999 RepID=UPI0034673CE4